MTRTTINYDEELYQQAVKFLGIKSKTELFDMGLRKMIAHQASIELAKMGGSDPDAWIPPRKRPWEIYGKNKNKKRKK